MTLPGVTGTYAHYPKQAVPVGAVEVEGVTLKLYHLEKPGEPVPDGVAAMARAALEDLASAWEPGDCGFAIVHRCGADFHFLLPVLWRGNNEAWEAVLYHQGAMPGFIRFDPAYPVVDAGGAAVVRPTFCVWELGIVAHEAAVWGRFLSSARTPDDLAQWRADLFSGEV